MMNLNLYPWTDGMPYTNAFDAVGLKLETLRDCSPAYLFIGEEADWLDMETINDWMMEEEGVEAPETPGAYKWVKGIGWEPLTQEQFEHELNRRR